MLEIFFVLSVFFFLIAAHGRGSKYLKELKEIKKELKKIRASLTPVEEDNVELAFYAIIDGQEQKVEQMFLKVSDQAKSVKVKAIKDKFGNPRDLGR